MKRLLIVASAAHLLFSLQLGDAHAAGPYDGEWIGLRGISRGPMQASQCYAHRRWQGRDRPSKVRARCININGTVWEDGTLEPR